MGNPFIWQTSLPLNIQCHAQRVYVHTGRPKRIAACCCAKRYRRDFNGWVCRRSATDPCPSQFLVLIKKTGLLLVYLFLNIVWPLPDIILKTYWLFVLQFNTWFSIRQGNKNRVMMISSWHPNTVLQSFQSGRVKLKPFSGTMAGGSLDK